MKNLFPLALTLLLFSCIKEPYEEPISGYEAVLMERSELENSIRFDEPRKLNRAGKIYIKDNLLFINELFSGVHVYDNSDPTQPKVLGFINIPGNVDISIDGDIMYADNAVDLIALRFTGTQVEILDRNRNVFPELSPPDLPGYIPFQYTKGERPENTVIVRWD